MALTFNGTAVLIPYSKLPDGFVKPVVSTVSQPNWTSIKKQFQILKSLVENVSDIVTFDNLLNDPVNGLNKKIEDELIFTFDTATNDYFAYAELREVRSNQVFGDDLYNDTSNLYRCEVRILVAVP